MPRKQIFVFLMVFLVLTTIGQAYATTYHLPKNTVIRNGLNVHFGDYWIGTSGTDATVTAWFESNWVNYTVLSSGTQEVYNGSKPSRVYIDGTRKMEGDGWTYSTGKVTITSSTSNVAMLYSYEYDFTFPETISILDAFSFVAEKMAVVFQSMEIVTVEAVMAWQKSVIAWPWQLTTLWNVIGLLFVLGFCVVFVDAVRRRERHRTMIGAAVLLFAIIAVIVPVVLIGAWT